MRKNYLIPKFLFEQNKVLLANFSHYSVLKCLIYVYSGQIIVRTHFFWIERYIHICFIYNFHFWHIPSIFLLIKRPFHFLSLKQKLNDGSEEVGKVFGDNQMRKNILNHSSPRTISENMMILYTTFSVLICEQNI